MSSYAVTCPDCGVPSGTRHIPGCDVSRCALHGFQSISCWECTDAGFEDQYEAQETVWRGLWPGVQECRDLDLYVWDFPGIPGKTEDLNKLAYLASTGVLKWNTTTEKWEK